MIMKKIAILTSGGDAPGMNASIRAAVRYGISCGMEVMGVERGYSGLIDGAFVEMGLRSVSDIIQRGGTILRTARCPEFKTPEGRAKGIENLRRHGVEGLIVIGGDGSFRGAQKLSALGIPTIGIPGTIDNDIVCTDYTIGFDTCLNTIMYCVDHIRDTTESHQRCAVIEVMGNHCGDLALFSGIAEGAEMIITPDHPIPEDEIMATLKKMYEEKRKRAIVIVSEKIYPDINAFAAKIQEQTGFETKAEVLGRVQRGGAPSAFDRVLAARMGAYAVDCLLAGKGGICIGMVNNKIVDYDIYEALKLPRDKHISMLRLVDILN